MYLLFCECCGRPKRISEYIMRHYVPEVKHFYCANCKSVMWISDELKEEARQLEGNK